MTLPAVTKGLAAIVALDVELFHQAFQLALDCAPTANDSGRLELSVQVGCCYIAISRNALEQFQGQFDGASGFVFSSHLGRENQKGEPPWASRRQLGEIEAGSTASAAR